MEPIIEIDEFRTLRLADLNLGPIDIESLSSSPADSRLFNIEFHRDGIRLRPRGFIGLLPLTSTVSVSVTSHVPPDNLWRMLKRSGRWPHLVDRSLRSLAAPEVNADQMIRLLANALAIGIDDILELGWLYEYSTTRYVSSFPKGRMLWNETMQHWATGRRHQIVCSVAERTPDNVANQVVRMALEQILCKLHGLAVSASDVELRSSIAALEMRRQLMQHISVVSPSVLLNEPMLTGRVPLPPSRTHYEPIIRISLEILDAARVSLGTPGSDLSLPHFAIEVRSAFEAYVRNLVREASDQFSSRYLVEDGMFDPPRGARKKLLPGNPAYEVAPDIVVKEAYAGRTSLVAEVKYVPQDDSVDRSYIERLLMYALAYRSRTVLLVHPVLTSHGRGLREIGRLAGIRICSYGFDLFEDLWESAEEEFVATVANLLDAKPPMPESFYWNSDRS